MNRRIRWTRRRAHDLRVLVELVIGLYCGRETELWMGDSHALHLNGLAAGTLVRAARGRYVWHLGPRLMFSLASRGFPDSVRRSEPIIRGGAARGTLTLVLVCGEIDVRCHLARRHSDLSFVADYVSRAHALAAHMGAQSLILVAPPPPSSTCPVVSDYPVEGTLKERLEVFHRLRQALGQGAASTVGLPPVIYVDATDVLLEGAGGLAAELTDDGIHTNLTGASRVRALLNVAILRSSSPGRH